MPMSSKPIFPARNQSRVSFITGLSSYVYVLSLVQDKIINRYAAMLREHNPRLASKVFLDEKGRLKVFKVKEATRHRARGKRPRSGRRNQRCRGDGAYDDALEGGTVSYGHESEKSRRGEVRVCSKAQDLTDPVSVPFKKICFQHHSPTISKPSESRWCDSMYVV